MGVANQELLLRMGSTAPPLGQCGTVHATRVKLIITQVLLLQCKNGKHTLWYAISYVLGIC